MKQENGRIDRAPAQTGTDRLQRGPGLSENVKTAILVTVSTLLFFALILGIYVKAGSDAYKKHGSFDSYTLQAMAWRRGEMKLDKNYPHLELAIINRDWLATHDKNDYMAYRETFGDINAPIEHVEGNEYYVSFPPVPSVPLFLVSFITGQNTPDNLLSILYVTAAFAFALLICRRLGYGCAASLCGGVLTCAASGALFLAANKYAGGPWFAAQTLSFMLTLAAFYCALSKRNLGLCAAFALLALAVGCRPFQIVYFIPLAYLAAKKYEFKILKTWRFYVLPALIGGTYMWYNYARFGSVFEFGHNYLPEFMRVPYGQFSLEYVKGNLTSYFKTLPYYADGKLEFTRYGFAFYAANPIFLLGLAALILFTVYAVNKYISTVRPGLEERRERLSLTLPGTPEADRPFSVFRDTDVIEIGLFTVLAGVHLFLLLLHRTNGGWQFGMRYTVDIVPAILMLLGFCLKPFLGTAARTPAKEATDRSALVFRGALIMLGGLLLAYGVWLNVTGAYLMLK